MASGYGMDASAYPADISDALKSPKKLEALTAFMKQIGQSDAAASLTTDNLKQLDQIVNTRLPQIDTELANLAVEIQAAQAIADQVNEQVKAATDNYEALESGKISAAVVSVPARHRLRMVRRPSATVKNSWRMLSLPMSREEIRH